MITEYYLGMDTGLVIFNVMIPLGWSHQSPTYHLKTSFPRLGADKIALLVCGFSYMTSNVYEKRMDSLM